MQMYPLLYGRKETNGSDGQSINDQNENRMTENGKAIKRYENRLSNIYSRQNEKTDTPIDWYIREDLFEIAPRNSFEYQLQFRRALNCSYRFKELPISNLLDPRPIIIITSTSKEYTMEEQPKERRWQEDDKYTEDQIPKMLKVKQIEDKYYGSKQTQTLLCGMCVHHYEALYFCTTCELNICCRCHQFHKEVWIMMNHVIRLLSENTPA